MMRCPNVRIDRDATWGHPVVVLILLACVFAVAATVAISGCGDGGGRSGLCDNVTCSDHGECRVSTDGTTPYCFCDPGFHQAGVGLDCLPDETDADADADTDGDGGTDADVEADADGVEEDDVGSADADADGDGDAEAEVADGSDAEASDDAGGGLVLHGGIGTVGEAAVTSGTLRLKEMGFEFGGRVCAGTLCMRGGVTP